MLSARLLVVAIPNVLDIIAAAMDVPVVHRQEDGLLIPKLVCVTFFCSLAFPIASTKLNLRMELRRTTKEFDTPRYVSSCK